MSASTTRPRGTVHDFSTLRLHSDETRVRTGPPTRDGLHYSRTRNTGRDIRGNRVARDAAGGRGVVPKRAVKHGDDNDEVQNAEPRVPRRRKRGRIDDDQVEFLGASGCGAPRHITASTGADATTIDANGKGEMMNWPVPSSDLLKCVHHFASQYYSARGLLTDRSREYRHEVRQRIAERELAQAAVGGPASAGPGANADTDTATDDPFTGDEEDETDYEKEDCHDEEFVKGRGVGEGKCTSSDSEDVPDMYRAFDGPALMAIGMLLQEHTSMLLKPNIPLGWEKESEAAGIVLEDISAGLDRQQRRP